VRILVTDDQAFWRRALEEALRERGFDVVTAAGGEEAWRVLQADSDVDVLVTDWVMPGMTGPELCRRVRESGREPYLPILLMTSRDETEDLVAGLDAGADAFLRKPFDELELLAQLRVAQRVLALEDRLAARIAELETAKALIERDLSHAAEVQRACMPDTPPDVPGVRFAWHAETCVQLGGDLFDVVPLDEGHVGLYALDVSGHGTPAALHSVSVSHVLHGEPARGGLLRYADSRALRPPCEVAVELNRRFPLLARSGHYFTFLYGILALRERRFRYVRAGHPPPLVLRRDGAEAWGAGGGVPIGVTDDASWSDEELALSPGEGLLLLSDGVLEMRDEAGEEFGLDRTLAALGRAGPPDAQRAVRALGAALDDFRKNESSRDDVTFVCACLDGPGGSA
jgi:sigma-B regulation protein RsbU (phosphoserine phosphatase)